MNYDTAARLGALLAKDYAEDLFKLLVNYQDISASEAASRLSLHIRTAQDFLDNLADLEIVEKTEVFEKKRPYFRYNLAKTKININLDLSAYKSENPGEGLSRLVRERAENGLGRYWPGAPGTQNQPDLPPGEVPFPPPLSKITAILDRRDLGKSESR